MAKVSVIIAARNEPYLAQTVDDVFAKSSGEIEVLVMLDGWKPDTPLKYRDNLKLIYRAESAGMRNSLNCLAKAATGKYLLKLDAHCAVAPRFDEVLQENMEDNWLVTPTRYSLDITGWHPQGSAVEYLYVTFPYIADTMYGAGFHGKKWIGPDGIGENMGKSQYYWMENARKDVKIDDIQIIQGSGWFMDREYFINGIDGLDEVHHSFYQEGNELCFKVWLSGGRCVVNKNTWYAHWHKTISQNYGFSKNQKNETQRFSTWVWMNNKWPKATRKIEWFANEKFNPIPSWPDDWQSHITNDNNFRIFDQYGHDGFKLDGRNQ